jgi:hypothetical protein
LVSSRAAAPFPLPPRRDVIARFEHLFVSDTERCLRGSGHDSQLGHRSLACASAPVHLVVEGDGSTSRAIGGLIGSKLMAGPVPAV